MTNPKKGLSYSPKIKELWKAISLILQCFSLSQCMQAWPCSLRQQLLKGWTLMCLLFIGKLLPHLPWLHSHSSLKGYLKTVATFISQSLHSFSCLYINLTDFFFFFFHFWWICHMCPPIFYRNKAAPLSYYLLFRIFLVSLCGYVTFLFSVSNHKNIFVTRLCMDKFLGSHSV